MQGLGLMVWYYLNKYCNYCAGGMVKDGRVKQKVKGKAKEDKEGKWGPRATQTQLRKEKNRMRKKKQEKHASMLQLSPSMLPVDERKRR
jgi:hypothetical protein